MRSTVEKSITKAKQVLKLKHRFSLKNTKKLLDAQTVLKQKLKLWNNKKTTLTFKYNYLQACLKRNNISNCFAGKIKIMKKSGTFFSSEC